MQLQFKPASISTYSNKPLPAKRHIPFINTAPKLNEDDHLPGTKLATVSSFSAQTWPNCETYLYAIDLFNQGYWWEAHELFKWVCLASGRQSEVGQFLEGLVQIAAGELKHFMQEEQGTRVLLEMGLQAIRGQQGVFLGIDITTFAADIEDCLTDEKPIFPRIKLVP